MAKRRKSLRKARAFAFTAQNGCCYYCSQPMWNNKGHLRSLATRLTISERQAKLLKCTAEHLVAHQDDGSSNRANIVAACEFCNKRRHTRKAAPSPAVFKALVQKRLRKGKWHGLKLASENTSDA